MKKFKFFRVNEKTDEARASTVDENLLLEERSFSPASRGQRSQDSGFSDSDNSLDNDLTPESLKRHRNNSQHRYSNRRRRRRRKQDEEDDGVGPVHTSTPKRESGASNVNEERSDR